MPIWASWIYFCYTTQFSAVDVTLDLSKPSFRWRISKDKWLSVHFVPIRPEPNAYLGIQLKFISCFGVIVIVVDLKYRGFNTHLRDAKKGPCHLLVPVLSIYLTVKWTKLFFSIISTWKLAMNNWIYFIHNDNLSVVFVSEVCKNSW